MDAGDVDVRVLEGYECVLPLVYVLPQRRV
jgi:hypothetical protein